MEISTDQNRRTRTIPTDIVEQILIRLPVKSLLRFKLVSKPWLSIITCPHFINSHLHYSLQTQSNRHVVFVKSVNPRDNPIFYSLGLDDPNSDSVKIELMKPETNNVDHRHSLLVSKMGVVGSCNGLVCFQDRLNKGINIYNPSTRRLLRRIENPEKWHCFGFGYDNVADDYKILAIRSEAGHIATVDRKDLRFHNGCDSGPTSKDVRLYSLKRASWKTTSRFAYECYENGSKAGCPCKFLNGALHWLLHSDNQSLSILVFNLNTEKYSHMSLPDDIFPETEGFFRLGLLGSELSLNCWRRDGRISDIHVMKEYGVTNSWTKLLSFSIDDYIQQHILYPIIAVAYSSCRSKVLMEHHEISTFWYDLKTGELIFKKHNPRKSCNRQRMLVMDVCAESLVSLGGY